MLGISQYLKILLILCIGCTIFCVIFVNFPSLLNKKVYKDVFIKQIEHRKQTKESLVILSRKRNFTKEQVCVSLIKITFLLLFDYYLIELNYELRK